MGIGPELWPLILGYLLHNLELEEPTSVQWIGEFGARPWYGLTPAILRVCKNSTLRVIMSCTSTSFTFVAFHIRVGDYDSQEPELFKAKILLKDYAASFKCEAPTEVRNNIARQKRRFDNLHSSLTNSAIIQRLNIALEIENYTDGPTISATQLMLWILAFSRSELLARHHSSMTFTRMILVWIFRRVIMPVDHVNWDVQEPDLDVRQTSDGKVMLQKLVRLKKESTEDNHCSNGWHRAMVTVAATSKERAIQRICIRMAIAYGRRMCLIALRRFYCR